MKQQATTDKELIILAMDPSMTGFGWCVMKIDGTILACGCIKTEPENKVRRIRKGDDDVRRIADINHILLKRIKYHKVNYLVTELPHGSQNSAGAKMIGVTQGILQTMSQTLGIPIDWFSEGDSKKALLGKISATKVETINAVDAIYDVPVTGKPKEGAPWTGKKYIDEAVADSISIFHVALEQSTFLQYYKKQNL